MKNKSVLSAIVGGAFFAVPYIGLAVGIIPSIAIGVCAFGASELVLKTQEKTQINSNTQNLYEILLKAKDTNKQIAEMIKKVENDEMKKNISEINDSINKIISTIEKKPEKYERIHSFFDYYLPQTLIILKKYDEIENQSLTSSDSVKFMKEAESMIFKINNAFKAQLANLYQTDIVDMGAEMKVFDSMLKIDGIDGKNDFKGE